MKAHKRLHKTMIINNRKIDSSDAVEEDTEEEDKAEQGNFYMVEDVAVNDDTIYSKTPNNSRNK